MGVLLLLLPLSAAHILGHLPLAPSRSRRSLSRLRGGLDAAGPTAGGAEVPFPNRLGVEEADAQDGTTVAMHSTTASELGLMAGDIVRLPPVRISDKVAEKAERPAPAREFPILLEDEHLIALDKPAGVAVHGGSGVSFGVIEQLRQARPASKFLELVHRLDRETSGILLVAKKRSALTHL